MAPGGADDHEETVPPAGPPGAGGAHGPLPPGTVAVGAFVGPYKLLRYLDEGGMGEVWLAERRDTFRQRVALKLLTPGRVSPREAIARFDQEREVLASLSHDHVARIYDGGIHGGRPWFAMEYVDGEPITDFCDRKGLGLRERLALFRQVCEAVTHAHRRGIIHRDIKPSNILVGMGTGSVPQAKVIDFGIAKALAQRLTDHTSITVEHRPIGTYEYMSPEQADPGGQDIDIRTDVYSLGVVLYELLAGVKPFDLEKRAEAEKLRIIREEDAPTPSLRLSTASARDSGTAERISKARREEIQHLVRALRSELEWIPLMAIRKDRERRYRDVDELSEDVQNYLDGKALLAAPESAAYRMRKYVRRNRVAVGAVTAVVLALAIGLLLALWGQARAEHEAQRAERLLGMSGELLDQLFGDDTGSNASLVPILDRLAPEVRAGLDTEDFMPQLASAVASGLRKVGRAQQAADLAAEAIERMRIAFGPDDERTLEAENSAIILRVAALEDFDPNPDPSRAASRRAALEAALASQRDVAARAARSLGPGSELALAASVNAAGIEMQLGRQEAAVAECRRVLPIAQRTLDPRSGVLADARLLYCVVLQASSPLGPGGDGGHARAYMQEALREYASMRTDFERAFGRKDPRTLRAAADHAMLLYHLDRRADARRIHEDIIPDMREVLGDANGMTLGAIEAHAQNLRGLGELKAAAEFLGAVLPAIRWSRAGRPEQVAALEALAQETSRDASRPAPGP